MPPNWKWDVPPYNKTMLQRVAEILWMEAEEMRGSGKYAIWFQLGMYLLFGGEGAWGEGNGISPEAGINSAGRHSCFPTLHAQDSNSPGAGRFSLPSRIFREIYRNESRHQ